MKYTRKQLTDLINKHGSNLKIYAKGRYSGKRRVRYYTKAVGMKYSFLNSDGRLNHRPIRSCYMAFILGAFTPRKAVNKMFEYDAQNNISISHVTYPQPLKKKVKARK